MYNLIVFMMSIPSDANKMISIWLFNWFVFIESFHFVSVRLPIDVLAVSDSNLPLHQLPRVFAEGISRNLDSLVECLCKFSKVNCRCLRFVFCPLVIFMSNYQRLCCLFSKSWFFVCVVVWEVLHTNSTSFLFTWIWSDGHSCLSIWDSRNWSE